MGQFHPFIENGEDLWLFTPDLGRSIPITYFNNVIINGIETKHYEADETVFSMSNENNFCYCPKAAKCAKPVENEDRWDLSGCTLCKDGVFSAIGVMGAPAYGSAPHFLSADPDLMLTSTQPILILSQDQ